MYIRRKTMQVYNGVWVSSIEHLDQFNEIIKRSSWRTGSFNIPEGFPCISGMVTDVPVLMFAEGDLAIDENYIIFVFNIRNPALLLKNLHKGFYFKINKLRITRIERYEFISPMIDYYTFNWIRVHTQNEEFLLYCGGDGPYMEKLQNSTDELYKTLLDFINE